MSDDYIPFLIAYAAERSPRRVISQDSKLGVRLAGFLYDEWMSMSSRDRSILAESTEMFRTADESIPPLTASLMAYTFHLRSNHLPV